MIMIIEEWKIIKDTSSVPNGALWEVSNLGRVKKNNELLTFKEGNYYIQICGDYLHRWIVKAFIGDIPKGYQIDHIDNNKHNNEVSNLKIVTHKENMNNPITVEVHKNCSLEYYKTHENPRKGKKTNKHSWNYGLTKETDERVNKGANSRIGVEPWNKGKDLGDEWSWNRGQTKETNESLKRAGDKISKLFKDRKKNVWFDDEGNKHWKYVDNNRL